jgi:hypothetical protein
LLVIYLLCNGLRASAAADIAPVVEVEEDIYPGLPRRARGLGVPLAPESSVFRGLPHMPTDSTGVI